MTAPRKPLLTEEEIREAAGKHAAKYGLKVTGCVAEDFMTGARFASDFYEKREGELLSALGLEG